MIDNRGPLGAKYSERGPEPETSPEVRPVPTDSRPLAVQNAEAAKRHAAARAEAEAAKARALDDALCQAELARSGRSILACQFIRDSAKAQGVTLREFINREIS